MQLYLYDVFLVFGLSCVLLSAFIMLILIVPSNQNRGFSILNKIDLDVLITDYKNSKVRFGGPLGIAKGLLTLGLWATAIGIFIRIMVFFLD